MSLTRELRHKDSPVGRFLREMFPHTRGPLAECRAALRAPLVSRLSEDASPAAYGQIGRAIDYRIRYHFAITPWLEMAAPRALGFVVRSEDARAEAQGAVGSPIAEDSKLTGACITGFFAALGQTIADIAPHRRIPNEAEELHPRPLLPHPLRVRGRVPVSASLRVASAVLRRHPARHRGGVARVGTRWLGGGRSRPRRGVRETIPLMARGWRRP